MTPIQKTLLRFMLIALAVCAGAGVLIVLIPGNEIMGRVCGSGFLTAVAIGFAMPAAKVMDNPAMRLAGVWALGATVATYLAALLSIWIQMFYPLMDERIVATAFALCGYGITSTMAMIAIGFKAGRLAGQVWFACTAAIFILLLVGIWQHTFWANAYSDKSFETAWLLFGMGMLAFLAMVGAGTDSAHWRWIGVVACAAVFSMGCWGIWNDIHEESRIFNECCIVAVGVAHANFVLRFHLPAAQRWMAMATIAAMAATCAGMTYVNLVYTKGFFDHVFGSNDLAARLTAAFAIAACCATLAVIILSRYNKRVNPLEVATSADTIREVSIQCPNCRKQQKAPTGSSPCVGCGLILTVRVALPHCTQCNYNTLNLDALKCPECGTPLPPRGVRMAALAGQPGA
ncbi:MAG: hypothetical protein K8R92_11475 [Planctomycetes bacterium]|nr:hypothetical protein [Planctomycetota bacterium]